MVVVMPSQSPLVMRSRDDWATIELEHHDEKGDLVFRLTVQYEDDHQVAARLEKPEGITPTRLQRFPWARWLTVVDAFRRTNMNVGFGTTESVARYADERRVTKAALAGARRAPSKGQPWGNTRNDAFYKAVAKRYLELRAAGEPNPTAVIASEQHHNRNTVAGWVRKARQFGHLPPARPGRAG